ncbi:putative Methyl-accepting chemotaxis protein [Candidatus Terasakiella magnetica]|uniref:Putative Methyl-accepting chemotaxis protein n=1 Tax=Candidatus Terasakiella magnetica TaxID=1867952 RepID=A0A1C3RGI6_9PROT|nr:globin-coupled sensor protein [Candidatus Terasakiella magnetica]SCA56406.1 putative Methyl-accepting chemotaxis protein [Candidatus Terasakiella magnetica]
MSDGNNKNDIEKRLEFLRIDSQAKKSMQGFFNQIEGELPSIVNEFYDHLEGFEETKVILKSHKPREELSKTQISHWESMFSGKYDDEYLNRARQIGRVHDVIGLEPRWYLGGYFLFLEKLIGSFLKKNGVKSAKVSDQIGAMLRSVCLDIDLAMMTYIESGELRKIRDQLLEMSDNVLREAGETISSVNDQTRLMQQNVENLSSAQDDLETQVHQADSSLSHTSQAIQTVAAATEELDASSQTIADQVQTSENIAQDAINQSLRSQETVVSLETTAHEISSVVSLVQNIASQTRLLALNATIEAARAGEAGKGFAVVASEVKNLASETEKAIDQVNAQSMQIQQATERAAKEIELTNQLIQQMGENVSTIAQSVEQQTHATSEISTSALSASDTTADVTTNMQDVSQRNEDAQQVARKVSNISQNVMRDVSGLSNAMTLLLRTSYAGNRRGTERVPMGMEGNLVQNGKSIPIVMADLGLGGVSLRLPDENTALSQGPAQLTLSQLGQFDCDVRNVTGIIVNVAFGRHTEESRHKVLSLVKATKENDKPYIDLVRSGAKRVEAAFEDALQKNKIIFEDFFDIDYQPVEGSNPRQLLTKFTAITDEYLPPIQEEIITLLPNIVFSAAVDRSAYLPTHNMVYSKDQSDDPVWNDANCRNRRIFADPAGLRAARNTLEVLVQAYDRVVGDQRVLLKEVDAPIYVRDRHWGNLRLAYKL